MARTGIVLLLLLSAIVALGQSPTGWINYNQVYYKIPVAREGVYRVSYLQLQENGFPVGSFDPRYLQLFHRGVEQAISVEGESDSQFNPTDYIEFYGRMNDGTMDAKLFDNPAHQPHKYQNLYSDTTAYFLTIGSVPGKRMTAHPVSDPGNRVAQSFVLDTRMLVLAEDYSVGKIEVADVYSSNFDNGEGWTGYLIWQGFSRDYSISGIVGPVPSAPAPKLELILTGRSLGEHTVKIYVGSSLRMMGSYVVSSFDPLRIEEAIEWSDLTADGRLPIRVAVDNVGKADYVSLCSAKLTYARTPDALGVAMSLTTVPDNSGTLLLEISNPESGATVFDVTEPANVRIIGTTSAATSLSALIPNADIPRSLYVAASRMEPARIVPVKFRELAPGAADYIIITHPVFRKPGLGYGDPVKAYADYRASETGGGYDTLIVHIQDLYDQFNYGETSSLAIHEFLRFISGVKLPSFVFLIGKGLELTYRSHRTPFTPGEYQDYIPPSGFPGSDVLYSVGIGGSGYSGGIPTGRLPATKPEHVAAYLNKVKETEALPFDDLWRKKILHLSGGIEAWEPLIFKNYLYSLQEIAEAPHMGAQVEAIAKKSREVQIINVSKQVNEGLGLITFLGHSSTSTLDFDIGNVTNSSLGYNNRGKYPMMIMNGCEVGSFFHKFRLFGEDWILADKLGATGFIAHNSYGLVANLVDYSRNIYKVAFNQEAFIGKGIGEIKLEAGKRFLQERSGTGPDRSQVQQMILLGDPALPLFGARKPDLEVRSENIGIVSFNNQPVTAVYDSFGIQMIIRNYGILKPQLFKIEIERELADNSIVIYDSLVNVPPSADTIVFVIRRGNEVSDGANHFRIKLDSDNIIDELNEENNTAEVIFNFQLNSTKNLFPSQYAIIKDVNTRLTFQATDVYSGERDFLVELDTVDTFNSPFLKQFTVSGKVLGMQEVELTAADTLAYYWRTRLAHPTNTESADWTMSSFTFIQDGPEGWAQVHFPQIAGNASVGLLNDSDARRISFEKSVLPVTVTTFDAILGKPGDSTSVLVDGTEYNMSTQGWGCREYTINLIAFDRKSTYPYIGIDMKWYEVLYVYGRRMICGRQPFVINNFQWDEVSSDAHPDMIDYVNNVEEGDSVLLFSIGNARINLWPEDAKIKLGELGISVDQINSLSDGEGVVIFGRKGAAPGTAKVFRTNDSPDKKIVVNQTITGGYTSGKIQSLIGPASAWQKITWTVSEKEDQDNIAFNIYGKKINGEEELIMEGASSGQDLSFIDAVTYPMLRIEFYTEDNTLLTPAQLTNWIVHFTPVAEGILLPFDSNETAHVNEGEPVSRNFGFYNISDKEFDDDLKVRYTLFNTLSSEGHSQTLNVTAPLPGDTTTFTISPSTVDMAGWNDIEVFANPRIIPERYYDNNLIQLRNHVFVQVDESSPVTDVTFDGRHIRNGDFVPMKPKIRITLWDENKFLLKQDTLDIRVFLAGPCNGVSCEPGYVAFSGPFIKWVAATPDTDFYLDYTPDLTPGEYRLIVEAADARGNKATQPFEITFVVDDEMKLVFSDPYPNPCMADLVYGFSLTGKDNAQDLIFEVRDLTGRKLFSREIMAEIPIGNHEFYWEGVDNSGNYLNTGVYLVSYRVTVAGVEYVHQAKVVLVR